MNDVWKQCSLQKAAMELGIQGRKVHFLRESAIPGKELCVQQLKLHVDEDKEARLSCGHDRDPQDSGGRNRAESREQ